MRETIPYRMFEGGRGVAWSFVVKYRTWFYSLWLLTLLKLVSSFSAQLFSRFRSPSPPVRHPRAANKNCQAQITGNTIFNALRMGDIEADKDDRPLEPPRLISVEVLLNPFDDIVPRNLSGGGAAANAEAEAAAATEAKKKRRKKQGKKDFKLLSFGEEADQEEKELDALVKVNGDRGVKSAHDALDDDKFSKDAAYDAEAVRKVDTGMTTEEGLRKAVKSAAKGAAKGSR